MNMNYKIGGCDVTFPHQAYGTQLSFMGKVIHALDKGKNALLEAPTGSGKTLSLLCSSLAWQQREKQRYEEGHLSLYNRKREADGQGRPSPVGPARDVQPDAAIDGTTLDQKKIPTPNDDERSPECIAATPRSQLQQELPPDQNAPDSNFCVRLDASQSSDRSRADCGGIEGTPCTIDSSPPSLRPRVREKDPCTTEDDFGEKHRPAPSSQPMHAGTAHAPTGDEQISQGQEQQQQYHRQQYDTGWRTHGGFLHDDASTPSDMMAMPLMPRPSPPKIFYATRTHSQIAQVVRELKRSGYAPRMAILASKGHYCVNAHARAQPSLEESCEEMLKERSCSYFNGVQHMINSDVSWQVLDVEDLCVIGKKRKACPYFVSQKWAQTADVVFCPYNYLIDPVIRRSMQINLDGAVVIFDEAHNIEDASREAASLDIDEATMEATRQALVLPLEINGREHPHMVEPYKALKSLTDAILQWFKAKEAMARTMMDREGNSRGRQRASRFESFEYVFGNPNDDMMRELVALGLGPDTHEPLWEAYQAARAFDEELANSQNAPGHLSQQQRSRRRSSGGGGSARAPVKVGSRPLGILSRIIQVVRMVHTQSENGKRDYRLAFSRVHVSNASRQHATSGSGFGARSLSYSDEPIEGSASEFVRFLSLWCLNPAVAFRQVAQHSHSVILTSGTLAPLDSFSSELGTPFGVRLEAPHVVNMSQQVWAGVIGMAPSGYRMQATYQHTSKDEFLDALGVTILQLTRHIPDGVLVFFPSYSLLDRVMGRWKVTGMWSRMAQIKQAVVVEPRGGGAEALQAIMREYYDSIALGHGGLFLAVCRGKVSEGLDFADANARGVIIVGIPFPNVKDAKVIQKRGFNDAGVRTMGLLNGSVWYEQQAFRALNQAVGRCIRHRSDWGAIIMVDERFYYPRYQKGLSRWLRGALCTPPTFDDASLALRGFFARLMKSEIPSTGASSGVHNGCHPLGVPASDALKPMLDGIAMIMGGRRPLKRVKTEEFAEERGECNVFASSSNTSIGGEAMRVLLRTNDLLERPTPPPPDSIDADVRLQRVRRDIAFAESAHGRNPVGDTTIVNARASMPLPLPDRCLSPEIERALMQKFANAPVARWVRMDVHDWMKWIRMYWAEPMGQMGSASGEKEVFEKTALGLEECFGFVRSDLYCGRTGMESLGNLPSGVGPPRGIQAVMAAANKAFEPRFHSVLDSDALLYGARELSGWSTNAALDAMQRFYGEEIAGLRCMGPQNGSDGMGVVHSTNACELPTLYQQASLPVDNVQPAQAMPPSIPSGQQGLSHEDPAFSIDPRGERATREDATGVGFDPHASHSQRHGMAARLAEVRRDTIRQMLSQE